MAETKPTKTPRWADTGTRVEPLEAKKDLGWIFEEEPPFSAFNWLQGIAGDWMKWFDERFFDGSTEDELLIKEPGTGTDVMKFAAAGIQAFKTFIRSGAGNGINATGGTSSGAGLSGTGGTPDGPGSRGTGTGSGAGVEGTGGSSGKGVIGTAGGGNADGGSFTGSGSGDGVDGSGGDSSGAGVRGTGGATNGTGVVGVGGLPNGTGVHGEGDGGGSGVRGTVAGGHTGYAVEAIGDSTSPVRSSLHVGPQDADPSTPDKGNLYCNSVSGLFSSRMASL